MDKSTEILKYSNPKVAQKKANIYFGKQTPLYLSTRKNKKYMVEDPKGKKVHFGQLGFSDFTLHKDKKRRQSYLSRASKIKGDWKNKPYSPNLLSQNILW